MTTLVHREQLTIGGRSDGRVVDRDLDWDFLRTRTALCSDVGDVPIVDLFSGCGGLTYGALEGLRHVHMTGQLALGIDRDLPALGVLQETLGGPSDAYSNADLGLALGRLADGVTREERRLFRHIQRGTVLLLAGPPCQGHSALNNHTRHDDPRNDLYLAVARVARLIEPRAIIVENVPAVGRDRRGAMTLCAGALENFGYEVALRRLNLHQLGVPQTRVRHVLVATRSARFEWSLPAVHGRDVRWAIEDLLELEGVTRFDSPARATAENQRRIDWLFRNRAYDLPNGERPACHHSDHSYRSMYGRLRWDAPAQTVTSGFGSMGQGRYVHPTRRRTLTPHEAARLQCLPDFVRLDIETRRRSLARMIGNAAPPLLTARIVEALVHQGVL